MFFFFFGVSIVFFIFIGFWPYVDNFTYFPLEAEEMLDERSENEDGFDDPNSMRNYVSPYHRYISPVSPISPVSGDSNENYSWQTIDSKRNKSF